MEDVDFTRMSSKEVRDLINMCLDELCLRHVALIRPLLTIEGEITVPSIRFSGFDDFLKGASPKKQDVLVMLRFVAHGATLSIHILTQYDGDSQASTITIAAKGEEKSYSRNLWWCSNMKFPLWDHRQNGPLLRIKTDFPEDFEKIEQCLELIYKHRSVIGIE